MNKTKVLICYNEPTSVYDNYHGKEELSEDDFIDTSETDISNQLSSIISGLQKHYDDIDVIAFNSNIESIIHKIVHFGPDVIFNIVESVEGIANYEAYAAGLYELLGISYTGNTPLCLGTCLDKSRTKQFLHTFGIKTPNYYIAHHNKKVDADIFQLKFPVILKLMKEDASIGISELSICSTPDEINNRLEFLFDTYKQDVLIEEYIKGREFNVAVLGNKVLPISEIDFTGLPKEYPKIVTYEGKWSPKSIYYQYTKPVCPAELDEKTKERIEAVALKCFNLLNCRDYARVDIRLNKNNVPYVIEVNPNPDISPDAGFARAAAAAGLDYPEMLFSITKMALSRSNKNHNGKSKPNDTKIKI